MSTVLLDIAVRLANPGKRYIRVRYTQQLKTEIPLTTCPDPEVGGRSTDSLPARDGQAAHRQADVSGRPLSALPRNAESHSSAANTINPFPASPISLTVNPATGVEPAVLWRELPLRQ